MKERTILSIVLSHATACGFMPRPGMLREDLRVRSIPPFNYAMKTLTKTGTQSATTAASSSHGWFNNPTRHADQVNCRT